MEVAANEACPDSRFTLVAGEGDGAMLGLAAGDAAGGASELGYSAVTEQATVIAYQLIERRRLSPAELVHGLQEMDGAEDGESVYRSETSHFRAWLDRASAGPPAPEDEPSLDGVARAAPLGVAFREDPAAVVAETLAMSRLFDRHAVSFAASVVSAAAVAAASFGQSGADLIAGVAQAAAPAIDAVAVGSKGQERLASLGPDVMGLVGAVGVKDGAQALERAGGDSSDPIHLMLAGLLLAAPVAQPRYVPIEEAARIGGSTLSAVVGAIVGARTGIRPWPWRFANDTWFAEIGRRLTRGPYEVRDLPIPYAVEMHLNSGSPRDGYPD